MIDFRKMLHGAKFAAVFAVALAISACANNPDQNSQANAAGAATPGSQQDFVVNVGDRVFFDTDQTDLSAQARATLDKQAQWLNRYSQYSQFTVEGHADERQDQTACKNRPNRARRPDHAVSPRRRGACRQYGTAPRFRRAASAFSGPLQVTKFERKRVGRRRGAARSSQKREVVQELAPSTVTARRFCDQQEMSSHTATGRSLP